MFKDVFRFFLVNDTIYFMASKASTKAPATLVSEIRQPTVVSLGARLC